MKVVIAMDSFKGSMTSMEAGYAAKEGVLAAIPDAEVIVRPLADGGEGTIQALCEGLGGEIITVQVSDPIGRDIEAEYAVLPDGKTAIIEMAQAVGLTLLSEKERNPYKTSTYGVGEIICDAIKRGCREFLIGIGGSATNDGGIGMLRALGYHFYDESNQEVFTAPREGAECDIVDSLKRIKAISASQIIPQLSECTFRVACDVTNPLCGKDGATYVYAPQKGLDEKDCALVDMVMDSYAKAAECFTGKKCKHIPGAGAAGGIGFAFVCFLGGELVQGANLVMRATELEECFQNVDVFVTGEGKTDAQTAMGKAPMMAAKLAKKMRPDCKVLVFSGQVLPDAEICLESGIDEMYAITPGGMSVVEAMQKEVARKNMQRAVRSKMATWKNAK